MPNADSITMSAPRGGPSPSWWLDFDRITAGGRDPLLIKGMLDPHESIHGVGPAEIDAVVRRMQAANEPRRLRVYTSTQRRDDLAARVLASPLPADRPVFESMQTLLDEQRLAFMINDLQDWSPALHARLGALLVDMFAVRGMPPFGAEQILFAGNYAGTPFGAHRGFEHAFLYHLGPANKGFHLWSPTRFVELTGGLDDVFEYDALLAHAINMVLEPGDLLYLPAQWFHIGTQQGYSCSVAVGLYDYPVGRWVRSRLSAALADEAGTMAYLDAHDNGQMLTASLAERLAPITASLFDELREGWLLRQSNAGFVRKRVDAQLGTRPQPSDHFRVRAPFRLVSRSRSADGAIDLYLAHQRVSVVAHRAWPLLVRALGSAGGLSIVQAEQVLGRPWDRVSLTRIFVALLATGGLERCG